MPAAFLEFNDIPGDPKKTIPQFNFFSSLRVKF